MKLIKELKEAGFFKFVEDDAQLQFVLQTLKSKLESENMIYFPNKSYYYDVALKQNWTGSGNSLEFRSCGADAEGMFRGGLINGLTAVKELFEKRNLKFHFENENIGWKEGSNSYIKHEIDINNKKYIIADGDFDSGEGSLHYLRQVEKIMNEQLLLQDSIEHTYKIISYYGEMIWYVIMEDKHFEIFERNKNEFSASQLIKE
jgi:hypothetical protein